MKSLNTYWRAIQEGVCVRCIDGGPDGECLLQEGRACPLKLYFPTVVETVLSVRGTSFEPYAAAVQKSICPSCSHRTHEGLCFLRDTGDCTLHRYTSLVVNAVEDVYILERKKSVPPEKP